MRAWELHEAGWKQKDIATALGVSEGAVSQWFKKAKTQGVEALRHQPPPGRQAQLSPEQMAQLPTLLAQGAEAFGFRGQVWTTARVVEMIRQQFGISYHPAHSSRLLQRLRYSQQKPITLVSPTRRSGNRQLARPDLSTTQKKPVAKNARSFS